MRFALLSALAIFTCLLAGCGSSSSSGSSGSDSSNGPDSGPETTCTESPGFGSQGTCANPQEIDSEGEPVVTYSGTVGYESSSYYVFDTTPGATYRFVLIGAEGNLRLWVYESPGYDGGPQVCQSWQEDTAPNMCLVKAGGNQFYLAVSNGADGPQAIELTAQQVPAPEAVGTEAEPIDLGTPPVAVTSSVNHQRSYYVLTGLAVYGVYKVRLEGLDGDANLIVSKKPFTELQPSNYNSGLVCQSKAFTNANEACEMTATTTALYVAVDGARAPSGATFLLGVVKTGGAPDNEGTVASPVQLTPGEARPSTVNSTSYYRFTSTPGSIYRITTHGEVRLDLHDDDASFNAASSICSSTNAVRNDCFFQANGSAVYVNVKALSGGRNFTLTSQVFDPESAPSEGTLEVPLILGSGVTSYTGRATRTPAGTPDGSSYYRFRVIQGAHYRLAVDPHGPAVDTSLVFVGPCVIAIADPDRHVCTFQATGPTALLRVAAATVEAAPVQFDMTLEQVPAPVAEGTADAPVDLGTPDLTHQGTTSSAAASYYRVHVTPGVTYSFAAVSTEFTGQGGQWGTGLTELHGWDASSSFNTATCCAITPVSDTLYLRARPTYHAGSAIELMVTSHAGEYPAEGILGGPVQLGTAPATHEGTVSVAHSAYTVETVKGQLYGVSFDDSTNAEVGVRVTTGAWEGCSVRFGGECRFYASGTSADIAVFGGPAAFTLNVHPAQVPPNQGTSSAPYPLAGPVVHEGTVSNSRSYYAISIPETGDYVWWVTTIDGWPTAFQRSSEPGLLYYCYGSAYKPCLVGRGNPNPIVVEGHSVGSHFTVHIAPKP